MFANYVGKPHARVVSPGRHKETSKKCLSKTQTGVRPPISNLADVALRHQREVNAAHGRALKVGDFHTNDDQRPMAPML